ncbi:hypothetical protein HU718_010380 [Pseudomonas tensinigenes]|uniref:Uncharacterized protein n=1 Tax=Pseudomonas tensinigenes TaxID=2745511 RepID=A0ABX8Q4H1_9PSED|nr:hypothetical protein [Pseudomonas tensinigenes]QXI08082.1 hypothetical protein HU718_010380 [Pseudomonas tensinigenes]
MREADHDCVQSQEDFTYVNSDTDHLNKHQDSDDATTVDVVKKNPESGLDSLGGGRLI